jgi:hypothetical protein
MIELGDIVRIKQQYAEHLNGKLGIVVVKGTWSRDVRVFDTGREYRFSLEELEKITK